MQPFGKLWQALGSPLASSGKPVAVLWQALAKLWQACASLGSDGGHQDPDAHGHQDPAANGHQDPDSHGHQDPDANGHQDAAAHGHQDPGARLFCGPCPLRKLARKPVEAGFSWMIRIRFEISVCNFDKSMYHHWMECTFIKQTAQKSGQKQVLANVHF